MVAGLLKALGAAGVSFALFEAAICHAGMAALPEELPYEGPGPGLDCVVAAGTVVDELNCDAGVENEDVERGGLLLGADSVEGVAAALLLVGS